MLHTGLFVDRTSVHYDSLYAAS